MRTIVLAVTELAQRLAASALEVQRGGVEEGDRHLAEQLLPAAIKILLDGIRHDAAVGDLLAEPSHRQVGVIEGEVFGAGNAEAVVPAAGVAVRARDHQSVQHREVDRALDVEAEPAAGEKRIDHLAAAGLPPQPPEHQVRADADPPQLSQLAAIVARQHDRPSRMPRCRCRQRIQHPGLLDLVATPQRLDDALYMASALAGVLDQIEILVGADLLDPDKHRGAPWRSPPKHHEKRDSVKTKRAERLSHLAPQNE